MQLVASHANNLGWGAMATSSWPCEPRADAPYTPTQSRGHGTRKLQLIAILGLGIFSAALSGCGKSEGLVAVMGKVTVDGKPLNTGSVAFHPDTAKGNNAPHMAAGLLDAQGNYKLVSATKEGAAMGWYKVTVTAQEPADPKNPYAPPKHIINPKYSDAQTSGLAIQVVEKPSPGAYDFKLTK